jgi:hypothetical protein
MFDPVSPTSYVTPLQLLDTFDKFVQAFFELVAHYALHQSRPVLD